MIISLAIDFVLRVRLRLLGFYVCLFTIWVVIWLSFGRLFIGVCGWFVMAGGVLGLFIVSLSVWVCGWWWVWGLLMFMLRVCFEFGGLQVVWFCCLPVSFGLCFVGVLLVGV